jgi:hypothetical protein
MLMGLLLGLPVMVRHDYLVNSPSFVASLIVINGVMLLLVIGNLAQVAIWAWLLPVLFRVPDAYLSASLAIHDVLYRLRASHPGLPSANTVSGNTCH